MKTKTLRIVQLIAVVTLIAVGSLFLSSCDNEASPTSAKPTISVSNDGLQKILTNDYVYVNGYVYYPRATYDRWGHFTGYVNTPWPGQTTDTVFLKFNGIVVGKGIIQSNGSYTLSTLTLSDTSATFVVTTSVYNELIGSYNGSTSFYHTETPFHDPSVVNIYMNPF